MLVPLLEGVVMRCILAGIVLTLMLAGGAAARPLDTITLDCVFKAQNTVVIKDGKLGTDNSPEKPMSFTITGLNEKDNAAIMVGNAGSTPLTFRGDNTRWVFVELTQAGNAMVTSMTVPSASGKTYAVHSRHAWILGAGLISQWAGTCNVR
jgi:hypothetical protein